MSGTGNVFTRINDTTHCVGSSYHLRLTRISHGHQEHFGAAAALHNRRDYACCTPTSLQNCCFKQAEQRQHTPEQCHATRRNAGSEET